MNVLALFVLGHQLAVAHDGQLIAFFEAISIGFDESDLGSVDALFLDACEKFVRGALVFLYELIPCGDFLVQAGDVLERIVGWDGAIEDAQKVIENFSVLRGRDAKPPVGLPDFAVERSCLIVFSQALQGGGFVELDDVGELAAILALVIVQAHQRRFHDVDAGHIFRNWKTISVFLGETLKILDNVEQVTGRRVTALGWRRSR